MIQESIINDIDKLLESRTVVKQFRWKTNRQFVTIDWIFLQKWFHELFFSMVFLLLFCLYINFPQDKGSLPEHKQQTNNSFHTWTFTHDTTFTRISVNIFIYVFAIATTRYSLVISTSFQLWKISVAWKTLALFYRFMPRKRK